MKFRDAMAYSGLSNTYQEGTKKQDTLHNLSLEIHENKHTHVHICVPIISSAPYKLKLKLCELFKLMQKFL